MYGCLHHTEHEALLVAPCSSLAPSLKQSGPLMIATSQMVTDKPIIMLPPPLDAPQA